MYYATRYIYWERPSLPLTSQIFIILDSFSVVEIVAESSSDDESEDGNGYDIHGEDDSGDNDGDNYPTNEDNMKERAKSTDSRRSKVSSASGGSTQGVAKCIMSGKEFQHMANLRIHIQSHLGTKAQLKSCQKCDR